ncbi:MAG: Tad domain-containing protein [Eubacteriales bacterium]|nr:Tad domain-containing protein [Eubacteriales bacterium]
MRYSLKNSLKNNKGTSTIIVAFSITLLMGVTALVTDVGYMYLSKAQLANAVDAAVLAGVQEIVSDPVDMDSVNSTVNSYINSNYGTVESLEISLDETTKVLTVSASDKLTLFFAKFFGVNHSTISATAGAAAQNIVSMQGARPLGIIEQDFIYGQQYQLYLDEGEGYTGNYGCLALGGRGSSIFLENMLNGYPDLVSVNDMIDTEPGTLGSTVKSAILSLIGRCTHTPPCTYDSYSKNCPRVIFCPIVNTLLVNGRKLVNVVGFGTFFLENVVTESGEAKIVGRFVTFSAQGETSSEAGDFGTYGLKLIN